MSFSKAVCVLCECPTADGAVLAVHVDKDKLQQWALNVCGHEIAHEIDDRDKICYFCLWQAEFLAQHDLMEESLAWWQENLELDDAALLLRRKYFEGEVEQCWVQLERVEMPSGETDGSAENAQGAPLVNQRFNCLYCDKNFGSQLLLRLHIRRKHKNAIRCENHHCITYFHTLEERNKHNEDVHQKQKMLKCEFCAKKSKRPGDYRKHILHMHKEFIFACSFRGCLSYFKSEIEMQSHFDSTHKYALALRKFQCNDCCYASNEKANMEMHITLKHLPKTVKCENCSKLFCDKTVLRTHFKKVHTSTNCSFCNKNVVHGYFRGFHLKVKKCQRCKKQFACSGLYRKHWKSCKEFLLKCEICSTTFAKPSLLGRHKRAQHRNKIRGTQYQNLGLKCDPCRRYYKSEKLLRKHIRLQHNKDNWKNCAHCSKSFHQINLLKNHLSVKHNLIEGTVRCQKCGKKFISLAFLNNHLRDAHSARETCKVCGKSISSKNMRKHLMYAHGD